MNIFAKKLGLNGLNLHRLQVIITEFWQQFFGLIFSPWFDSNVAIIANKRAFQRFQMKIFSKIYALRLPLEF